ncbi:MAG: glycosyltransferase family 2 protein [Spirochaetes bacterium]|nr:glycosyltransferase family 2 protein [Spirochaetota bacterium]
MKKQEKISFSLIAHNEEQNIGRCMQSIKWADEIILIDCASTDRTVPIAKKYTKKIFHRKNDANLNINKSFGISKTKNKWVFYIDPDEQVTPSLKREILSVLKNDQDCNAFKIPRKNFYIFRFLKHGGNYPDYQVRLFKKDKAEFPNRHVHEKLHVKGKTGKLNSPFNHYPYSSIKEYIQKLNFYTSFQSKFWFDAGVRTNMIKLLFFIFFRSNFMFIKKYFLKLGFLDGLAGLFAALGHSATYIISNFKLYELLNKKRE